MKTKLKWNIGSFWSMIHTYAIILNSYINDLYMEIMKSNDLVYDITCQTCKIKH